jgi:putative flippase GtrA
MSDLERRGSYTPRRVREQRAYRVAVVGGTAGVVAVVGVVLAVLGVVGAGLPLVAAVVAAICFVLFRRLLATR